MSAHGWTAWLPRPRHAVDICEDGIPGGKSFRNSCALAWPKGAYWDAGNDSLVLPAYFYGPGFLDRHVLDRKWPKFATTMKPPRTVLDTWGSPTASMWKTTRAAWVSRSAFKVRSSAAFERCSV